MEQQTAELPAPAAPPRPAAPLPGAPTEATPPPAPHEVRYKHGPEAQKFGWWWGTGRRKTAVARVRLRPGKGIVRINGREIDDYFTEIRDRMDVVAPLKATGMLGKVDVIVKAHGGGFTGQAGAILLGVARALRVYDSTLESVLREHGYLTRDAREVERKKYGLAGARRRFQFSKR
jgi:small subunit ribosomal protein S9